MAVLETIPVLLSSSSSSSFLDTSTVIALTVFFALLCACIIIGHLLEENRWANESITALLLGLCCGVVVLLISKFQSSRILVFSEDLFFLYLLPPIIFNAGFQVKKKRFFKNFTTILLFGVVGTVISFCLISLGAYLLFKRIGVTSLDIQDYLAVGAILSATDSVCTLQVLNQDETPLLYSIVFGEGVVNDATSIVLFNAVQSLDVSNIDLLTALKLLGTFLYLFFTSTVLGIAAGLISAYIIKTLYFGRWFIGDNSISFPMDLIPFNWFHAICFSPGTSIAVSSTLFALVLVGRAAFVFPIANITNWIKKRPSTKIELRKQFIIWWAGLMRGAVTIALSYNKFANSNKTLTEDSALMITSTIIVVLFSTVVFGSITKPLIEAMLLRNAKPVHSDATDIPSLDDLQILFLENCDPSEGGSNEPARRKGSLSLLISNPTSTVHYFWRKFDDKFMRPVFGGRGFVPFVPSSPSGAADPQTS
ncbi:sodium/hydrogen exchanger 1 [Quercus suber]|uniref:sodium/hydrogen exchanger 1 n=1 Tax=Quercus suber TaxID=58331 RepID=UPI0032E04547